MRPAACLVLLAAVTLGAAAGVPPAVNSGSNQQTESSRAPYGARDAELLHKRWQDEDSQRQCFGFSLTQSIAREDFDYPDITTGERKTAKKGDLINLRCDSVVCPNPVVPDCYMDEGVCGDDEWCQLEDQVRFGPWAMADGETPNLNSAECELLQAQGYSLLFEQARFEWFCNGFAMSSWGMARVCRNTTHWGPWKPVRGRCSQYRSEQQSCNAYFAAVTPASAAAARKHGKHQKPHRRAGPGGGVAMGAGRGAGAGAGAAGLERLLLEPLDGLFHSGRGGAIQDKQQQQQQQQQQQEEELEAAGGRPQSENDLDFDLEQSFALSPHYVVSEADGRPPLRPLLCAPGLVCTGDVDPMPNTCVKVRPPNVCYQGPWWDSTSWCKVDPKAQRRIYAGLPLEELKATAQALLVQLPVEHFVGPINPGFWAPGAGDVARRRIQGIVAALWPERYREQTSFPLDFPDPRKKGPVFSAAWNATAASAQALYRQSNKVWSTIQTLIHNCRDPMPARQVQASRALAVWLRQHFMCCNCRGMWANYVLNNLGLPPTSSSRYDHTRWWWRAQNMVSEHAANSRGGHPWVWASQPDAEFAKAHAQYGGKLTCQNPWFLPYEFAELMWRIPDDAPPPPAPAPSGAPPRHHRGGRGL